MLLVYHYIIYLWNIIYLSNAYHDLFNTITKNAWRNFRSMKRCYQIDLYTVETCNNAILLKCNNGWGNERGEKMMLMLIRLCKNCLWHKWKFRRLKNHTILTNWYVVSSRKQLPQSIRIIKASVTFWFCKQTGRKMNVENTF